MTCVSIDHVILDQDGGDAGEYAGAWTTHQWRKGKPRKEGCHEAEPREEEDAAIFVHDVEDRYRIGLSGDRVDFRRREHGHQHCHGPHDVRCGRLVECFDEGLGRRTGLPLYRRLESMTVLENDRGEKKKKKKTESQWLE